MILNVGIVIILAALVVVIGIATACQIVDTTYLERGQMIEFKAGGVGQIMRRSGMNEGMPWNLTPVFRYEVR